MKNTIKVIFFIFFSSLVLNACVSKGTYHAMYDDYDSLLTNHNKLTEDFNNLSDEYETLNIEYEDLSTDFMTLASDIPELELSNLELKKQKELLKEQKDALEAEKKEAEDTQQSLIDSLNKEIEEGQITITKLKNKVSLNISNKIIFDSGRATLKQEGKKVLEKISDTLENQNDKTIIIEGHSDNDAITGALKKKFDSNWELSAARAINVTKYLIKLGVKRQNISAAAFADTRPTADNDTNEGKKKNRRIEIVLISKEIL